MSVSVHPRRKAADPRAAAAALAIVLALSAALLCFGRPAAAQEEVADATALRLNFADRQLMLNEMIAKALCLTDQRIQRSHFTNQLAIARVAFHSTFDQLTEGSKGLSLARETRPRIRASIERLKADWVSYAAALTGWSGARWGKDLFAMKVYEVSEAFDRDLGRMMEIYRDAYQNGTLIEPDVRTAVLLAGRQRTLTQRMTKELCWLTAGYESAATKAALAQSIAEFEKNLQTLREGGTANGLPEDPPGILMDVLEQTAREFAKAKPLLEASATGPAPEKEELQLASTVLDNVLKSWVEITSLYGLMHKPKP